MATVSVALSEPEYEHAATKSIKRPLDSYPSDYELPPAVKIKTTNNLTESFLPASIRVGPAEDSAFSDVEITNTKEISSLPTNYGHRLIPQLIDERAKVNPQGSVWSVPKSSNLADGFRDISYGQVARAINKAAWWIDEHIGKSTTFEKLAYIGTSDLRYSILTIAAQKTGHTAFFSSHWNTTDAHLHLLETADCQVFITPGTLSSTVTSLLAKRAMRILVISELDDLLFGPPVETYPYRKTFEEARYDPFVACHTSGSTGFPKLIIPTHGTMAACDAFQNFPAKGYPPTFVEAMKGKRVLAGVPPFHGAGICLRLAMPIYYDCTAVEGPLVPLTADVVNEVHKHGNVSISILRPAIWEGIAENPEYLDQLSSLDYAMNVACVLPKDLGDTIATKTSLMSLMGATEAMILPVQYPDKEDDWQYWAFSECMGAEFRHFHEDLYEMVMVRNPNYHDYQAVFFTFPEKHEYPMKDLYSPHPTKPRLWIYRGRADDVIVLMDGKKMHPTTMETIVSRHPQVRSAMVFGQARLKPALLLEITDPSAATTADEKERLLDCVWPTVERANQQYSNTFHISRDQVLFTGPGKPMVKTGKGSVQRIDTLVRYEDEINSFYEVVGKACEDPLVKDL